MEDETSADHEDREAEPFTPVAGERICLATLSEGDFENWRERPLLSETA